MAIGAVYLERGGACVSTDCLHAHLRYLFIYLSRSTRLPPPRDLIRVVGDVLGESIPQVAVAVEGGGERRFR